jgi:hypothetical protein
LFGDILTAPFAGGHAEAFFKPGVEQTQVVVAAIEGNIDDFGIGADEQVPGALEAELDLAGAEGDAELLAKEAAEMAFAAMEAAGEGGEGMGGELALRHLPDKLTEALEQLVIANGGFGQDGQKAGHGDGPEVQSGAAAGKLINEGLGDEAGKEFADGIGRREGQNGGVGFFGGIIQQMAFVQSQDADEKLGLNGEKVKFQGSKLAGPTGAVEVAAEKEDVAEGEGADGGPGREPVALSGGDAQPQPALTAGRPFCGGKQLLLLQNQILVGKHSSGQDAAEMLPKNVG